MKNLFSRKAINFGISSSSSSWFTIKGLSRTHPPAPPPNSSSCHTSASTITTWISQPPLGPSRFHKSLTFSSLYINPFPLSLRFIHSHPGPAISSKNGFGIGIEKSKDVLVNDMLSSPNLDERRGRIVESLGAAYDQFYYGRPRGNRLYDDDDYVDDDDNDYDDDDDDEPPEPSETLTEDVTETAWKVANEIIKDMPVAKIKDEIKTSCQFQDFEGMPPLSSYESKTRSIESQMLMHMEKDSYPEEEDFDEMMEFLSEMDLNEKAHRDLIFEWLLWKIAECESHPELLHTQEEDQPGEAGNREHETRNQLGFLNVSTNVDKEAKSISQKRKLVLEEILSLQEENSLHPLLVEWIKLLLPRKIDWIDLLDRLKIQNIRIYDKVAELVLPKESSEASVEDCSKLIGSHANPNHLEYTERVLRKMNEKGILTDILTLKTLIHIYSEAGDLDRAEQTFKILRDQGFQPDTRVINSLLMAYVRKGKTQLAESLIKEMGSRLDIELTKEMYMTLVWSFARSGDVAGTIRIANAMEAAGFHLSLDSCYTFLVNADGRGGDVDMARKYLDDITELKQTTAELSEIMACEKEKLLDKGSKILLQFEEDGYEHSIATYFVLVALLDKLHAVEKTENLLWEFSCESSKAAK